MKLKAFLVVCRNTPDFKLGEKLKLIDDIEDCDYIELSKEENYNLFHKDFNSGLRDILNTHDKWKTEGKDLNDYYSQYLVITSARYIVQGFFRI